MDDDYKKLARVAETALLQKRCWRFSVGGAAGTTFQMAFGRKMRSKPPVLSEGIAPILVDLARHEVEGETTLVVWCAWRIERAGVVVSSWDDSDDNVSSALSFCVESSVASVKLFPPACDLKITFDNAVVLHVFCDKVSSESSFGTNWDLFIPDQIISVGLSSHIEFEHRQDRPLGYCDDDINP